MAQAHSIAGSGAYHQSPSIRRIGVSDLRAALAAGLDDFWTMPSHLVFLSLIYPILGIVLAAFAFNYDVVPLLYPLVSGFALVGPLAAISLYELSRRREQGLATGWREAFEVVRNPAIGSIVALGFLLLMLFVAWLLTAQALYAWIYGATTSASFMDFAIDVLTTGRGWTLIVVGNLVGLVFAAIVLAISVVSFPLLVDPNVGSGLAVGTSIRAVTANPGPMALWGLIVAVLLGLGSLPLFVGLAIVLPILGHATWHLYRMVVDAG